jgi:hypothetical protein
VKAANLRFFAGGIVVEVLGIGPRTVHMLSMGSTTKPQP